MLAVLRDSSGAQWLLTAGTWSPAGAPSDALCLHIEAQFAYAERMPLTSLAGKKKMVLANANVVWCKREILTAAAGNLPGSAVSLCSRAPCRLPKHCTTVLPCHRPLWGTSHPPWAQSRFLLSCQRAVGSSGLRSWFLMLQHPPGAAEV